MADPVNTAPKFIEFEIGTYCNRTCAWCPNSFNSRGSRKEHVSASLWRKFIDDLNQNEYSGWLGLHSYNEPMADPYFFERLDDARTGCATVQLVVYTNGDYLTEKNLGQLEKLGISEIRVTLYPKTKNWHEGEIYQRFINLSQRTRLDIRESEFEQGKRGLEAYKFLGENTVIHIVVPDISTYTNRAGSVGETKRRVQPCTLLQRSAAIDYRGNVKLCCEIQDVTSCSSYAALGNIEDSSIFEIWQSKALVELRKLHKSADFSSTPICYKCDKV